MRIRRYAARWWLNENQGEFVVQLESDEEVVIPVDSAGELQALKELLDSAQAADYDPDTEVLSTGWTSVGGS